jgi:site-specific DNA-cytosine methylase
MKPIAIGSQTFAGGFVLGMRRYFAVPALLEWDRYGTVTSYNNNHVPMIIGHGAWDEFNPGYPVDVVFGNPPCAAWSQNNPRASDWRNSPYLERTRRHLWLVEDYNPKIWVTESVPGAFKNGLPFLLEMSDYLLDRGYAVTFVLHDAQYLGLPQKRPRLFMVAHKVDIPWVFPDPETVHVPDAAAILSQVEDPGVLVYRKVHEETGLLDNLHDLKPGERLRDLFDRLHPEPELKKNGHIKGRPSFCEYRLPETGPANTMAGSYTLIHPTKDRPLGINEIKALCSYPVSYKFENEELGKTSSLSELARAVMPGVAQWLAQNLAAGLAADVTANPQLNLLDFRKSPVIHHHPWNPHQPDDPQYELLHPVVNQAEKQSRSFL